MWIRKGERDLKKGVDSPMPTQLVSTEEFIPRRQTEQQKKVEHLIGKMADEKSKKLGMDRRAFHGEHHGPGHLLPGVEQGLGQELRCRRRREHGRRRLPGEVAQGRVLRHRRADPLHQRHSPSKASANAEFVKNMGFNLKDDVDAYSYHQFVKELFFDSENDMIVISGVPGKERQKDVAGKTLEGAGSRRRCFAELADVREEARIERTRGFHAGAVPGQPRAEPLLGQGEQPRR